MKNRSYYELTRLKTFEDRFDYLYIVKKHLDVIAI